MRTCVMPKFFKIKTKSCYHALQKILPVACVISVFAHHGLLTCVCLCTCAYVTPQCCVCVCVMPDDSTISLHYDTPLLQVPKRESVLRVLSTRVEVVF